MKISWPALAAVSIAPAGSTAAGPTIWAAAAAAAAAAVAAEWVPAWLLPALASVVAGYQHLFPRVVERPAAVATRAAAAPLHYCLHHRRRRWTPCACVCARQRQGAGKSASAAWPLTKRPPSSPAEGGGRGQRAIACCQSRPLPSCPRTHRLAACPHHRCKCGCKGTLAVHPRPAHVFQLPAGVAQAVGA